MNQPKSTPARCSLEAVFHVADLLRKAVDQGHEIEWEYNGGESPDGRPDGSYRIVIDVKAART